MSARWVLHVDLDQFQAAVEVRRNPDLAGLPIIVGGNGDPNEPRKVVTCASYPARAFGVHAGMPLRTAARKCPDATFLPLDTDAYDEASEEVMSLLRDFGHPVEVWGWDEAYVGADLKDTEDPFQLAEQIREVVAAGTGLSCSVGISDNKQRAKVATGFGKPAGVYALTEDNWMAVMGDRDVDALWGVGPKTAKKLAGMGITTVADLASTDAQLLTSTFGPTTGLWILLLAKGGGDTEVSAQPWVARSRSHVITFPRDLTDRAEIDSAVVELAELTLAEIVDQGRVVTRVAVTVRTKTFFTRTKIRKLAVGGQRPTDHRGHRTGPAAPVRTGPPYPTARCAIGTRPTRRRLLVPARRLRPQRTGEKHVDLAHRHAVGPPHRPLEHVQRPDVRRRVDQEPVAPNATQDPVGDMFG